MQTALVTLQRGLSSYAQQQFDGWRTGTRGSQAYVTLLLMSLIGVAIAVVLVFGDVVPMVLWVVYLMLGVMLLRFVPLLLVAAAVMAAAVWTASRVGLTEPREVSSLVILALAALLALLHSSRQRSGLPVALSEAVLSQLRDRLQRQGVVPDLPNGWRSQSAVLTAHGPSYAGDFLVADLRDGRWLEMALVDVCGKGVSVGPQALQFAGALGGLIGALPPGELMTAANGFLLRQDSDESLATAVHIKVDLVTGDYTITSAGHPPALHWHLASRGWAIDNARGMALGVISDVEFSPSHGRLRPGEALMFYTDGVIEAGSRDIDDGIEWLRHQALHVVDARGFTGLPRRVLRRVPRGNDDRAILLLERQPLTSPELASERFRGLSG